MTFLTRDNVIIDVTARQFVGAAPPGIFTQFYRELMVTGLWTRSEYNTFFQSIYGAIAGF
jgi:hypothetical protein